jgi:hypothetical protein
VDHRDTLLTIAELAVALAGFASIVSVVAQRAEEDARLADSYRLRLMLEVALRNAGFAVLPCRFFRSFRRIRCSGAPRAGSTWSPPWSTA